MNQILEKEKLEILLKPEEKYAVIPKDKVKEKEVKEQKAYKKLRLFTKNKKTINIEKVKTSVDAKIYRNKFIRF